MKIFITIYCLLGFHCFTVSANELEIHQCYETYITLGSANIYRPSLESKKKNVDEVTAKFITINSRIDIGEDLKKQLVKIDFDEVDLNHVQGPLNTMAYDTVLRIGNESYLIRFYCEPYWYPDSDEKLMGVKINKLFALSENSKHFYEGGNLKPIPTNKTLRKVFNLLKQSKLKSKLRSVKDYDEFIGKFSKGMSYSMVINMCGIPWVWRKHNEDEMISYLIQGFNGMNFTFRHKKLIEWEVVRTR